MNRNTVRKLKILIIEIQCEEMFFGNYIFHTQKTSNFKYNYD